MVGKGRRKLNLDLKINKQNSRIIMALKTVTELIHIKIIKFKAPQTNIS